MGSGEGMGAMRWRWGLGGLAVVWLIAGCADRQKSAPVEGELTVTPGGLDFKRVAIFDGREAEVLLRNVGRARITIRDVWVEGPAGAYVAGFIHEGPHQLGPESEAVVRVRFTPREEGPFTGSLVVR